MGSLLNRVVLADCQAQHVGELLPGLMRRLGVAIACGKDPEVLLLDVTLLGLAERRHVAQMGGYQRGVVLAAVSAPRMISSPRSNPLPNE